MVFGHLRWSRPGTRVELTPSTTCEPPKSAASGNSPARGARRGVPGPTRRIAGDDRQAALASQQRAAPRWVGGRLYELRSQEIAARRMTIPPGHRFEATQALRQVVTRAIVSGVGRLSVRRARRGRTSLPSAAQAHDRPDRQRPPSATACARPRQQRSFRLPPPTQGRPTSGQASIGAKPRSYPVTLDRLGKAAATQHWHVGKQSTSGNRISRRQPRLWHVSSDATTARRWH